MSQHWCGFLCLVSHHRLMQDKSLTGTSTWSTGSSTLGLWMCCRWSRHKISMSTHIAIRILCMLHCVFLTVFMYSSAVCMCVHVVYIHLLTPTETVSIISSLSAVCVDILIYNLWSTCTVHPQPGEHVHCLKGTPAVWVIPFSLTRAVSERIAC